MQMTIFLVYAVFLQLKESIAVSLKIKRKEQKRQLGENVPLGSILKARIWP